jgi:hypothetical protein
MFSADIFSKGNTLGPKDLGVENYPARAVW